MVTVELTLFSGFDTVKKKYAIPDEFTVKKDGKGLAAFDKQGNRCIIKLDDRTHVPYIISPRKRVALKPANKQIKTVKELRKAANLSQQEFADFFNISKRTVENWESRTTPPDYLVELFVYKLENEGLLVCK